MRKVIGDARSRLVGVPEAVSIRTTSSGTSLDAASTCSWVAGQVRTCAYGVEQRLRDTGRSHDVRLLAQVLRDHQASGVEGGGLVLVDRAHHELRAGRSRSAGARNARGPPGPAPWHGRCNRGRRGS